MKIIIKKVFNYFLKKILNIKIFFSIFLGMFFNQKNS